MFVENTYCIKKQIVKILFRDQTNDTDQAMSPENSVFKQVSTKACITILIETIVKIYAPKPSSVLFNLNK